MSFRVCTFRTDFKTIIESDNHDSQMFTRKFSPASNYRNYCYGFREGAVYAGCLNVGVRHTVFTKRFVCLKI